MPSTIRPQKSISVGTVEPKIILSFVSPQSLRFASGPGAPARGGLRFAPEHFPFEKDWYAKRVPKLRVEFVGHPMIGSLRLTIYD